jgi:NAD(P)-dependent dehydrogenase (short-subunit alcohol dehydrogenase family)
MRGERTVLVTGGTKRIGKAISDALRADGWRVITSSHREDSVADIVADLAEPLGAAKLYSACLRLLGGNPPDALVNNAALFIGDDATLEAVNFEAPRKLTTLMAGRETGRGAVVNILDCRVLGGMEPRDAYERSKRELRDNTTKSAALFADTIRVNAVAPGPVIAPEGVSEKAGEMPLGRPLPEDVARAVVFLLEATATTGCIIPVDGGQSALCDNRLK